MVAIAYRTRQDEVLNADLAIVANDTSDIVQVDALCGFSLELGDVEPAEPVEVDRPVRHPATFERLGDLRRQRRLAGAVDTGDEDAVDAVAPGRFFSQPRRRVAPRSPAAVPRRCQPPRRAGGARSTASRPRRRGTSAPRPPPPMSRRPAAHPSGETRS